MPTTSLPADLNDRATDAPAIGPIIVALGGSDASGVLRAAQLFQSTAVGGMTAVSVLEPMNPYLTGEYPSLMSPEFEEERATGRHASLRREIRDAPNSADWETKVVYGDPSYALSSLEGRRAAAGEQRRAASRTRLGACNGRRQDSSCERGIRCISAGAV